MFKNIKRKIKKQLIKLLIFLLSKLGYDYYSALADTPVRFEKVEVPLITVCAEANVDYFNFYNVSYDAQKQEVYRLLSESIGKEVIKYAKFSKSVDLIRNSNTYRAEIRVEKNSDSLNCIF